MKKILICITFSFIICFISYSQQLTNYDKFYSFSGGLCKINGVNGYTIQNKYFYSFKRFFSLGFGLTNSSSFDGDKNKSVVSYFQPQSSDTTSKEIRHYSVITLSFSGYFTPLKNENNILYLGVGINSDFMILTELFKFRNTQTFENKSEYNYGVNLSIGYSHRLTNRLGIGINTSIYTVNDYDASIQISLDYKL